MGPTDSVTMGTDRNSIELTEFRYALLFILAEGSDFGLGLKRRLQQYYGVEINHGKLYPNLDALVDAGLVEKSERNKRTNDYLITPDGLEVAVDRVGWEITRLVEDEETAASLLRSLEDEVLAT